MTGPAFALARSERELWSASGHSGRYLLDPEHGSHPDVALRGTRARRRRRSRPPARSWWPPSRTASSAALRSWGIDSESAAVVWKTVVGSAWPTALSPSAESGGLSTLGQDGREVLITPEQATRGGFVVVPVSRPGAFTLPAGLRLPRRTPGQDARRHRPPALFQEPLGPGRVAARTLARGRPARARGGRARRLAGRGARPRRRTARLYLIEPSTGRSVAEPFVPQFDRDRQGTWLAPAILDSETVILADDVGRVRRISLKTTPVPRLVSEAETDARQPDRRRPGRDGRRGPGPDRRRPRPLAGRARPRAPSAPGRSRPRSSASP